MSFGESERREEKWSVEVQEIVGAGLKAGPCKEYLLAGRVRRAHVHVAQVLQCGALFAAEAAGEIRIVQALDACGFRHVLQYSQLLLHHLLTIPRHLAPPGQDIVLDVVALTRRQVAPRIFFLAQVRLLPRRHVIPLIELLANPALLVGRKILKRLAVLKHAIALLGR